MLGGINSGNKQIKSSLGYTIIEVLIVLAVSGLMFIVAVNFINGKQGKAAFTQGTNEMASQIQGVIEQVTDGQFSDIPLNCQLNGAGIKVDPGAQSQGTNPGCVFLGKILRFHSTGDSTYAVVSLAGKRITKDGAGNSVQPSLSNVAPTVVASLTRVQNIPQRLTIKSITVNDASTGTSTTAYNFGFAEGLGTVANASFQSGAQSVAMIYSPTGATTGSDLAYASSAFICMTDETRYAKILIGNSVDNASQLSVRVKVVPTEEICVKP
jgi:type II secretory pathway pseudopilin PulG